MDFNKLQKSYECWVLLNFSLHNAAHIRGYFQHNKYNECIIHTLFINQNMELKFLYLRWKCNQNTKFFELWCNENGNFTTTKRLVYINLQLKIVLTITPTQKLFKLSRALFSTSYMKWSIIKLSKSLSCWSR